MKLSIIIPVYNVEKYLESCITSCLSQDLDACEYEVILVDDGSSDNSLQICNQFEAQNKNITVFTQPNAGQSVARNKGLDYATGKYIWFVDSDDWVGSNIFARLIETCERLTPDILAFSAIEYREGELIRMQDYTKFGNDVIMKGKDFLHENYSTSVPFHIFNRSYLEANNLKFYEGVFHEDEDFMLKAFYQCERLGIFNQAIYNVRLRPGSTTRSSNPKKAYDLLIVANSLSAFSKNNVDRVYQRVFHRRISLLINGAFANMRGMNGSELKIFKITLDKNRHLFSHFLRSHNLKYTVEGVFLKINTSLAFYIYRKIFKLN